MIRYYNTGADTMAYREKISCVIGTKNAERDIRECIEAVKWVDEIIVLDDYSSDRTLEIARQYTDKIYQKKMTGYTEWRDFGLQKASYRWVMPLDADERVTPQLRDEIIEKLSRPEEFSGFLFRRLNIFLGREVRHCGWYEASTLRLFNKEKVSYDPRLKYLESMKVTGSLGFMRNDLLHYTCRSLESYINRVNVWSGLNTQDLITKGYRITALNSVVHFVIRPCAVFLQKYFLKSGYRDGFAGFAIASLSAVTYFLSSAKLWEAQKYSANTEGRL
jgi:glycosyltransferase involved in cell wall biosynthesis